MSFRLAFRCIFVDLIVENVSTHSLLIFCLGGRGAAAMNDNDDLPLRRYPPAGAINMLLSFARMCCVYLAHHFAEQPALVRGTLDGAIVISMTSNMV